MLIRNKFPGSLLFPDAGRLLLALALSLSALLLLSVLSLLLLLVLSLLLLSLLYVITCYNILYDIISCGILQCGGLDFYQLRFRLGENRNNKQKET